MSQIDLNAAAPKKARPPPLILDLERKRFEDLEGEDRRKFVGFTSAELIDLGALGSGDESDVKPNNLQGPIHPAFALANWEAEYPAHFLRKDLYSIEGSTGNWSAYNPEVWKVLEPCLRLVSKFLDNAHISPWYDAIIFGTKEEADDELMGATQTFRRRLEHRLDSAESKDAMKRSLQAIAKNLNIGICAPGVNPRTGQATGLEFNGFSINPLTDTLNTPRIYLAYDILIPLMDTDLGPSTRLALEFHIASTLLHEFAHIIQFHLNPNRQVSMFFENETIAEVGASFEVATFGGYPKLILQQNIPNYRGGRYRAGMLLEEWLGTRRFDEFPMRRIENSKLREYRACPLYFLEELGQEDFWRFFVAKWGAAAFKPYPLSEGRSVRYEGHNHEIAATVPISPENPQWLLEALRIFSPEPPAEDTDEDRVLQFALRRISEAKKIEIAVESRRNGRQVWSPKDLSHLRFQAESRRPGIIRLRAIELERNRLRHDVVHVKADKAEVEAFLAVEDCDSDEYAQKEDELFEKIEQACHRFRDLIKYTWDPSAHMTSQNLLQSYEAMSESLGLVSREPSFTTEQHSQQKQLQTDCESLIKQALASYKNGDHARAAAICNLVIDKENLGFGHVRATAHFVIGTSIENDVDLKIWHLEESANAFRLLDEEETAKGNPSRVTKARREWAQYMLSSATRPPLKKLETRRIASFMPIPNLAMVKDIYNQIQIAQKCFFENKIKDAEAEFLAVLEQPNFSAYQFAQCHAFLARIPTRKDRRKQAETAILRLLGVESVDSKLDPATAAQFQSGNFVRDVIRLNYDRRDHPTNYGWAGEQPRRIIGATPALQENAARLAWLTNLVMGPKAKSTRSKKPENKTTNPAPKKPDNITAKPAPKKLKAKSKPAEIPAPKTQIEPPTPTHSRQTRAATRSSARKRKAFDEEENEVKEKAQVKRRKK